MSSWRCNDWRIGLTLLVVSCAAFWSAESASCGTAVRVSGRVGSNSIINGLYSYGGQSNGMSYYVQTVQGNFNGNGSGNGTINETASTQSSTTSISVYIYSIAGAKTWFIGTELGSVSSMAAVQSTATEPFLVTATWYVVGLSDTLAADANVTVTCLSSEHTCAQFTESVCASNNGFRKSTADSMLCVSGACTASQCCDRNKCSTGIYVSGLVGVYAAMSGVYTYAGVSAGTSYYTFQSSVKLYLYFFAGLPGWVISDTLGSGSGFAQVQTSDNEPYSLSDVWQLTLGSGRWMSYAAFTAVCLPKEQTCSGFTNAVCLASNSVRKANASSIFCTSGACATSQCCDYGCTLPASYAGYAIDTSAGGCPASSSNLLTASSCKMKCDGPTYSGTPALTCSSAGGKFALSGCTQVQCGAYKCPSGYSPLASTTRCTYGCSLLECCVCDDCQSQSCGTAVRVNGRVGSNSMINGLYTYGGVSHGMSYYVQTVSGNFNGNDSGNGTVNATAASSTPISVYIYSIAGANTWFIGTELGSVSSMAAVQSTAVEPFLVTTTWYVVGLSDTLAADANVTVGCLSSEHTCAQFTDSVCAINNGYRKSTASSVLCVNGACTASQCCNRKSCTTGIYVSGLVGVYAAMSGVYTYAGVSAGTSYYTFNSTVKLYLYYFAGLPGWVISDTLGSGSGFAQVQTSDNEPYSLSDVWQLTLGSGHWLSYAAFTAVCLPQEQTCTGFTNAVCLASNSVRKANASSIFCTSSACTTSQCCDYGCILPASYKGYAVNASIGGCPASSNNLLSASSCKMKCDGPTYEGNVSVTCPAPGGKFAMSGCAQVQCGAYKCPNGYSAKAASTSCSSCSYLECCTECTYFIDCLNDGAMVSGVPTMLLAVLALASIFLLL